MVNSYKNWWTRQYIWDSHVFSRENVVYLQGIYYKHSCKIVVKDNVVINLKESIVDSNSMSSFELPYVFVQSPQLWIRIHTNRG